MELIQFKAKEGVKCMGRIQSDRKVGCIFGIKTVRNLAGVTCWGKIQSDRKVGCMFGVKTAWQSGRCNMFGEGPEGQQSGREFELLQ